MFVVKVTYMHRLISWLLVLHYSYGCDWFFLQNGAIGTGIFTFLVSTMECLMWAWPALVRSKSSTCSALLSLGRRPSSAAEGIILSTCPSVCACVTSSLQLFLTSFCEISLSASWLIWLLRLMST